MYVPCCVSIAVKSNVKRHIGSSSENGGKKSERYQKDFQPNQSRGKRFCFFFSHSIKFLRLHTKAPKKGRKKDNGSQLKSGTIRAKFFNAPFLSSKHFFSRYGIRVNVSLLTYTLYLFFGYILCRIA